MKGVFRKSLLRAHIFAFGAHFITTVWSASFNTPVQPRVSLIHSNSGVVRVKYDGQTNFQYIIRASTNLPNWFNLTTNIATNPATTFFIDNAATNARQRFYSAAAFKSSMFYYGAASGNEAASFLLYVRTNDVGTLLGLNTSRQIGESIPNLVFNENGYFCGQLLSFASGCLTNSPLRTTGTYTNITNSIGALQAGARFNFGLYRKAAGFYAGTYTGSCLGTVQVLISADGVTAFYFSDGTGGYSHAWLGTLDSTGSTVDPSPVPGSLHISATLNSTAFTIGGTFSNGCADKLGSGSLQLSIVEHAY